MVNETQHERPPDPWITRGNALTMWVIAVLSAGGLFYLVATNTDLSSVPVMVLVFSNLATAAVTCVITQNTTRGKANPPDDTDASSDLPPDGGSIQPLMMSGPGSSTSVVEPTPTLAPHGGEHFGDPLTGPA